MNFVNKKVPLNDPLGIFLQTLGERIKFVQKNSGKIQTVFADSLGVSKGSLILYQKNERFPDSSFLQTLCQKYQVNPAWLLLGEGEPFIQEGAEVDEFKEGGKVLPIDAAVQLLREAEEETGVSLNSAQRQAVLPILRKALTEDRRKVNELIRSMFGGKEDG